MKAAFTRDSRRARWFRWLARGAALAVAATALIGMPSIARAASTPVPLGTAANFAVLAGSTVTSTGPTIINGDLGLSPGTSVTGFPPGQVNGTIHAADSLGNFLGRGWVNPHQTVQVCTTGIPATKPIDELLCQATRTIKNAQGHTEQKSYICPSDGSPCQDIGVFSTPQRNTKEDGGTVICVSLQNATGDSIGIFLKAHAPVEKR